MLIVIYSFAMMCTIEIYCYHMYVSCSYGNIRVHQHWCVVLLHKTTLTRWPLSTLCACFNPSSPKKLSFFCFNLFSLCRQGNWEEHAFFGCSSSHGKLQIWKPTKIEAHKPLLHEECPCLRLFTLHRF